MSKNQITPQECGSDYQADLFIAKINRLVDTQTERRQSAHFVSQMLRFPVIGNRPAILNSNLSTWMHGIYVGKVTLCRGDDLAQVVLEPSKDSKGDGPLLIGRPFCYDSDFGRPLNFRGPNEAEAEDEESFKAYGVTISRLGGFTLSAFNTSGVWEAVPGEHEMDGREQEYNNAACVFAEACVEGFVDGGRKSDSWRVYQNIVTDSTLTDAEVRQ